MQGKVLEIWCSATRGHGKSFSCLTLNRVDYRTKDAKAKLPLIVGFTAEGSLREELRKPRQDARHDREGVSARSFDELPGLEFGFFALREADSRKSGKKFRGQLWILRIQLAGCVEWGEARNIEAFEAIQLRAT